MIVSAVKEITDILKNARTIAMVGVSNRPDRDSYMVFQFLAGHGYKVIPINPNHKEISGISCCKSLTDVGENVDIVNIFRRSEEVLPVVKDAVEIRAKTVWMQLGVFNAEAAGIADKAGLNVIVNRCIKIDFLSFVNR